MTPASQKNLLKLPVCFFLAAITYAAFAGVAHNTFITLDDRTYVVVNSGVLHGISWTSIKWAFSTFYAGYWLPITWLSHALDCQLFGLNPAGHHLMNLAFHIANVILLFLLLENLTAKLWPSAFVALLFAIHPMRVESVAWIAERKDVLSSFFFLLTLLAYARYAKARAGTPTQKAWPLYILSLFLFALGLMAKPMLVTMPLVLLLLDYWPLGRFNLPSSILHPRFQLPAGLRNLFIEKIPFFLLSAIFAVLTWLASNAYGAIKSASAFSPFERMAHVPVSYAWYVLKLFWPANLSVYYPLQSGGDSMSQVLLASLFLLVLTGIAVGCVRKCPAVFIGWLWFLVMLLPVIGLLQAGDQAYADRFTYLPYIGLFIAITSGIPILVGRASSLSPRLRNLVLCSAAILVTAACFWRTVVEVQYWKDGPTLFKRAIALDPKNGLAWMCLGFEHSHRGEYDQAITCMKRATILIPFMNDPWHNLGKLLAHQGDYNDAQNAYQTALQYTSFKGDQKDIYNDIGDAFAATGQYDQAIVAYKSSLEISPKQPDTQAKIGQCYLQNQFPDLAATAFQAALDLQPDNGPAHLGLATILQGQNRDAEALAQYRQALATNTNSLMALNNLAWLLATDSDPNLRNGAEAVTLAEHACELTRYQKAVLIGTLGAAYAEAGRFDDAVTAAQKAHDIALAHGEKDIAARNTQLMQLYQSHKAFHSGK